MVKRKNYGAVSQANIELFHKAHEISQKNRKFLREYKGETLSG